MNDTIQTTEQSATARLGRPRKRWSGYLTPHRAAVWGCSCLFEGTDGEGSGLLHLCERHAGAEQ